MKAHPQLDRVLARIEMARGSSVLKFDKWAPVWDSLPVLEREAIARAAGLFVGRASMQARWTNLQPEMQDALRDAVRLLRATLKHFPE